MAKDRSRHNHVAVGQSSAHLPESSPAATHVDAGSGQPVAAPRDRRKQRSRDGDSSEQRQRADDDDDDDDDDNPRDGTDNGDVVTGVDENDNELLPNVDTDDVTDSNVTTDNDESLQQSQLRRLLFTPYCYLCDVYKYDSTSIRRSFDGCPTV